MISIIIPAYNEEKYIEKTIQSIKDQTTNSYEIIVVANGCTDRTQEIASKYTPHSFVINRPNVSLARNIGAQHASGDILIFLDADTRLAPNAVEEIKKQFSPAETVATLHGHPNASRLHYKIFLEIKNLLHLLKLHTGSSGIIITKKDIFHKVGGFDAKLSIKENSAFIRKAKRYGKYKVIRNTTAITSTRRYERWGLLKTMFFWCSSILSKRSKAKYEAVR